jgi:hypothetical protein
MGKKGKKISLVICLISIFISVKACTMTIFSSKNTDPLIYLLLGSSLIVLAIFIKDKI